MLDASIRKVILNLLLEFDESTFSLNVESQAQTRGKEEDGEGVY